MTPDHTRTPKPPPEIAHREWLLAQTAGPDDLSGLLGDPDLPEVSGGTFEVDIPDLDVPDLDLPEVDVPALDLPEVDVPAATPAVQTSKPPTRRYRRIAVGAGLGLALVGIIAFAAVRGTSDSPTDSPASPPQISEGRPTPTPAVSSSPLRAPTLSEPATEAPTTESPAGGNDRASQRRDQQSGVRQPATQQPSSPEVVTDPSPSASPEPSPSPSTSTPSPEPPTDPEEPPIDPEDPPADPEDDACLDLPIGDVCLPG